MSQDTDKKQSMLSKQLLPLFLNALNKLEHEALIKWIGGIFIGAVAAIIVVLIVYFSTFGAFSFTDKQDVWGQFGDYVGGVLNPIFAFCTMLALALSIVLQSKLNALSAAQLEYSRKELELTREQLARSAKAQEESEKALSSQARSAERSATLTAINYLISYHNSELEKTKLNRLKLELEHGGDKVNGEIAAREATVAHLATRIAHILDELSDEAMISNSK